MHPVAPRVLVIDDDDNIRMLTRMLFEFEGYQVLSAPNAEIGLTMAATQLPHIILLDIAMPHRNGMDVYLHLRDNPLTASIPVLVFSAALTREEVQAWRSMPSVVDVIAKPFDTYELTTRIDRLLRHTSASPAGDHASANSTS